MGSMNKRLNYLFLSIFILFFLSCAPSSHDVLIDSFEGELNEKTVDFGSSTNSSVKIEASTDKKVCGAQSLKIIYELKPSGYMWVARGFNLDVEGAGVWLIRPEQIEWQNYMGMGLYMYGTNSGGVIAFDIKDKGKEMWRFLIDDDFSGWKEIIMPFNNFFARKDWQPQNADNNNVLDFPIMSFQLEPRFPPKGIYYFDCVKLIKKK